MPRIVKARGAKVPVPANDTALEIPRDDVALSELVVAPEVTAGTAIDVDVDLLAEAATGAVEAIAEPDEVDADAEVEADTEESE